MHYRCLKIHVNKPDNALLLHPTILDCTHIVISYGCVEREGRGDQNRKICSVQPVDTWGYTRTTSPNINNKTSGLSTCITGEHCILRYNIAGDSYFSNINSHNFCRFFGELQGLSDIKRGTVFKATFTYPSIVYSLKDHNIGICIFNTI